MKKTTIIILIAFLVLVGFGPKSYQKANDKKRLNNHNLYNNYQEVSDNDLYVNFNDLYLLLGNNNVAGDVDNYINNREILINTAEDLFEFSQMLSYSSTLNTSIKQLLASKSYLLGSDINYSVMKSRRFMPIGYEANGQTLEFSGTFDGQGFEISGLYFESFQKFSYVDEQDQINVYSNYFSMFTKNSGTIKNFGLINPVIDLENEHQYLTGFSYIVGLNENLVENVYVEDNRSIYNGGGIRAVATKVNLDFAKTAAAIVNRNNGTVNNIYFVGNSVVGIDFINAFLVEPLIYHNNTNSTNLVYDTNQYLRTINVNGNEVIVLEPVNGLGVTTNNLKSGTSSLANNWFYYKDDSYPKLWGLNKDINNNLLIGSARDLYIFTKLLKLNTLNDNKRYNNSNYLLVNDINLNHLSYGAYATPNNDFGGSFKGLVINGKYPQINNLVINKGVNKGTDYYVGLFSELSGTVENIVLYNAKIDLIDQDHFFGQKFHVGAVAGRLNNGTIKNVSVTGELDLSSTKIGSFNIGGIVGTASGTLDGLLNDMTSIVVGKQDYGSSDFISGNFNLGGIVGANNTNGSLILYNALNRSTLTSINNNIYQNTQTNIKNNIGGIIGLNNNTNSYKNELGLLSNYGNVILNNMNINQGTITTYLGGIIGLSSGVEYNFTNRFGKFSNHGKFIYNNLNTITNVAGILNSNHNNTSNLEFTQIYNYNDLLIDNNNTTASSLINHFGNANLTVSQAYSSSKIDLSFGKDLSSAINVSNNNIVLKLNYVDIVNNIEISNINLSKETSISGVTLHEKTNFLNIFFSGKISNLNQGNISGNYNLWVSGVTKVLSPGYYMKNTINEGEIDLTLNIGSSSSNNNIFVAGLVNRNLSGDLHNQDNSAMPIATIGIINSINKANIDIHNIGYANILLGGITSLNGGAQGGSIQDVINVGNLKALVDSGTATYHDDASRAGFVNAMTGGIFIGGITAVVTYGQSRIFDTTNGANILGIGNQFVRTGGILGSVLRQELEASKMNSSYFYNGTDDENIRATRKSVLSNGINYGDINAVTKEIGIYPSSNPSRARPGIYSSSGGVIGYGLSKMVRMINHGKVTSTDVAGGIVGATTLYNTDASNGSRQYVYVDINTAINYGDIRAIRKSSFLVIKNNGYISENDYYGLNDPWIIPTNSTVDNPGAKRGFGGIFGRIQRGQYHYMSDQNGVFDLVLNMNPNIDLIGRLDQYSVSLSEEYFDISGQQYFSAKEVDLTQRVFTGIFNKTKGFRIINNSDVPITFNINYNSTSSWINFNTNIRYTSNNNLTNVEFYEIMNHNKMGNDVYRKFHVSGNEFRLSNLRLGGNSGTNINYDTALTIPPKSYVDNLHKNSNNGPVEASRDQYDGVKHISEVKTPSIDRTRSYYVYGESFPLRSDESLQEYIYYASNELLAEKFETTRPNGMYVLASSSGSTFGSVLPKNFKVTNLQKLNRDIINKIDYNNPSNTQLEDIDENLDSYYNKLLSNYIELYQTKVNEKSELLSNNQKVEILDRNDNHLYGVFENNNFTGRELFFNINKTMITNGNYNVDFDIIRALLPENAIIARPLNDNENIESFISSLQIDLKNGLKVATTNRPDLTFDLNSGNQLSKDFVVYSEAAISDDALINYKTRYKITLNITNVSLSDPIANGYRIDNITNYTPINQIPNLTVTNKFGIRFNDINNKLANGFDIKQYLELYYVDSNNNEILVDNDFYNLVTQSKVNNIFSFDLTFSDELRSGNYVLKYRYYFNDIKKNINVSYKPVRNHEIYNLLPYNGFDFNKNTNNYIEVLIPYGYDLLSLGQDIITTYNDLAPYLDNKKTRPAFIEHLATTPFFDISTITVQEVIEDLYNVYYLTLVLEDGTTIENIKIKEAKLDPTYFKEGNRLQAEGYNNSTIAKDSVTREAIQTMFSLTYFNMVNDFYDLANFTFNVKFDGEVLENYEQYILISTNNQLNIVINNLAQPGIYLVEIKYKHLPAGYLEITKLEGVSAYLENIEFSEFVAGIEYPLIKAGNINSSGIFVEDASYKPAIYIGGIDYDNADINNTITNFKVYGEVSGTPLYDYLPYNILNYLPLGSSIQRKFYTNGVETYTNLVNKESEGMLIQDLYADYTVDPKTGEFNDDEDVFIEYRVVSENGLSSVNYFINVTDIKYNFQAVFNIIYNGQPVNKVNKFDNEMILITMTNYITNVDEVSGTVTDKPNTYPEFNQLIERQTTVTMFNHVKYENVSYLYNFGSNLSGFYQIDVLLSDKYTYNIQVGNINDNNTLKDFSEYIPNTNGKYYYISESPRMRTKIFTITILDKTPDNDWGFTDKDNPWN